MEYDYLVVIEKGRSDVQPMKKEKINHPIE